MKAPKYERGINAALDQAAERLDGKPVQSTSVRLGTAKLQDGRDAQIHLLLTTNPDDFAEEGK